MTPPTRCEACPRLLCGRGNATTGLCAQCRSAAAAFVREWMADLLAAGTTRREIAEIVGTTVPTVNARLRERRLALEAA